MPHAIQSIAIFGGTFDPVHVAHLRTAQEVLDCLGVADFRFLPAGQPALRGNAVTPARHRLAMLRLALADHPRFSIDERELRRSGTSYTVDTLREIRAESPHAPMSLIIGSDAAGSLDRWHRWREIFDLAHVVIMQRPGHAAESGTEADRELQARAVNSPESLAARTHGLVHFVEVIQLPVSSSAIRALVRSGRSPRYLVPASVMAYIGEHALYV